MDQGKQLSKFERNPCIRFRDNCDTGVRTDGRPTTDKFRFRELCWHSHAELIMTVRRSKRTKFGAGEVLSVYKVRWRELINWQYYISQINQFRWGLLSVRRYVGVIRIISDFRQPGISKRTSCRAKLTKNWASDQVFSLCRVLLIVKCWGSGSFSVFPIFNNLVYLKSGWS